MRTIKLALRSCKVLSGYHVSATYLKCAGSNILAITTADMMYMYNESASEERPDYRVQHPVHLQHFTIFICYLMMMIISIMVLE